MSGRELTVRFDPAGPAASKKIAKIKTTKTGSYSFKTTATKSGTWTVSFGGKRGSLRSDSARVSACVYTAGRWQCPVTPSNPDLDCPDVGKTGARTDHPLHCGMLRQCLPHLRLRPRDTVRVRKP